MGVFGSRRGAFVATALLLGVSTAALGSIGAFAAERKAYVMLSGWGLYPPIAQKSAPLALALDDIAAAHVAGIVYGTLGVPPWIRKNRNVPASFDPDDYNASLFERARAAGATIWLQLRYYDNWVEVGGRGENLTAPEINGDKTDRDAFVAAAMHSVGTYATAFPQACTIILGEEETPYHAKLGSGLFWAGEALWNSSAKASNEEHLQQNPEIDRNFIQQFAGVNSLLISAIRGQYPSCRVGVHIGHEPLYQAIDGEPAYERALKAMPPLDFTFYDLYEKVSRDEDEFSDKLTKRVNALKSMGQTIYYLAQLHTTNTFGHGGGRTPGAEQIDKTFALAESLGVEGMGYYTKNAAPSMCGRAETRGIEPTTAECNAEDTAPLDPNVHGQTMVYAESPNRWRYGLKKLQEFLAGR